MNKCLEVINVQQGTASHIDGTGLICEDEELTSLFDSLAKLNPCFRSMCRQWLTTDFISGQLARTPQQRHAASGAMHRY